MIAGFSGETFKVEMPAQMLHEMGCKYEYVNWVRLVVWEWQVALGAR
jgi:hypothetical protein